MRAALLLVLGLLVVAPRAAAADDHVIALLPLAADSKLALYGQPVASEVAKSLEQQGFTIVVVTSTAPVPSSARLVIDGRIVRDGDSVKLEARVRDPNAGKVVAELSASAPTLTRIDEAAADLAKSLAPVLTDGLAAQDKPPPPGDDSQPPPVTDTTEPEAPKDTRPLAAIDVDTAPPRSGDPIPNTQLRRGATRLANLLGYRTDATATGAGLTITIQLLAIHYHDGGVITAKARAHVKVTDGGTKVFDRIVRTDTLVGGRGDRKDAVLRAAVDEIVDIAMPRVKERLKK
jgi:hypothetical protein